MRDDALISERTMLFQATPIFWHVALQKASVSGKKVLGEDEQSRVFCRSAAAIKAINVRHFRSSFVVKPPSNRGVEVKIAKVDF